jgi:amidophosphoribosyltransferase
MCDGFSLNTYVYYLFSMAELKEKCAVFGAIGKDLDVSHLSFYGLFALQHRGQEATGICASNGSEITSKKGLGLVSQVFTEEVMKELKGNIAIGHNRYSTAHAEGPLENHIQPYVCKHNRLALAHNGNLPCTKALEDFLKEKEIITHGHNDSKLMHLAIEYYLDEGLSLRDAVKEAYPLFTGAFSLLVMTHDTLIGVRDAYGMRPLCVGIINGGYAFASETCALSTIGAEVCWEVGPGEMVECTFNSIDRITIVPPKNKFDIFEFVYFARPDSQLMGKSVYQARWSSGYELAREFPIEADIVVPVPETSIPSAIGYAKYAKIPLEMALTKNRYIHRTFIEPNQEIRDRGVALKLTVISSVVKGKRVIVIDDSIVRSTTSRQIVEMFFKAGATEVHFLVAAPPVKYPDFYGIDTPTQDQLIASSRSVPEIQEVIGATTLGFLSLEGLIKAIDVPAEHLSTACFTGEYPIDIGEHKSEINFDV